MEGAYAIAKFELGGQGVSPKGHSNLTTYQANGWLQGFRSSRGSPQVDDSPGAQANKQGKRVWLSSGICESGQGPGHQRTWVTIIETETIQTSVEAQLYQPVCVCVCAHDTGRGTGMREVLD